MPIACVCHLFPNTRGTMSDISEGATAGFWLCIGYQREDGTSGWMWRRKRRRARDRVICFLAERGSPKSEASVSSRISGRRLERLYLTAECGTETAGGLRGFCGLPCSTHPLYDIEPSLLWLAVFLRMSPSLLRLGVRVSSPLFGVECSKCTAGSLTPEFASRYRTL